MANFIPYSASGTAVMAAKLNSAGGVEQTGYIRSSEFGSGESGVFTPVESDVSDGASVSITSGTYSRVGNVVTMSFRMSIQMGPGTNATTFFISMPIASNFSSRYQANGVVSGSYLLKGSTVDAQPSNGLIVISIESENSEDFLEGIFITLQYLIV
jgi:hypothetical protein